MKLELNVPSSLDEITLGQYQKYLRIAENNPSGSFLDAKMIEIFCGVPLSDSYKLKMGSVNKVLTMLDKVLNTKPNHVTKFTMNGVDYGFIPDLNEMSLGEYIDLDNNLAAWENMHIAMNVLYRPIKISKLEKYNIVDYTALTPEVMKDMPLSAVIGSIFFLYNLGITLSKHMIHYSAGTEEEIIQVNQTLQQNGVGINQFMDSLTEILQDLKISLN